MSKFDKTKEQFLSFYQFFVNKKTKKGFNITYSVVWNLILIFILIGVISLGFAGGTLAGYFAALVKDEPLRPYEDMKRNIYDYEETSNMYFADNLFLGTYRADLHREEVKIDEVPEVLVQALLATEDEYFYEHPGIVPKALLRAMLQEVLNSANQTGGSTLTQQLIKNQILTNEVSFDRKAKEILLALRLEHYFEKEEILEAYLNVSPFGRNSSGRNIAGVKTASRGIFGVEPNDLTLEQAAYIAGLPQSPFAYTPFTRTAEVKSPEGLRPGLDRMRHVLNRMNVLGYITEEQHEKALAYDITKDFIDPEGTAFQQYPHLTMEIEEHAKEIIAFILAEQDGYEEKDLKENTNLLNEYKELAHLNIRQSGYHIHTTINKEMFDKMQEAKDKFQFGPELDWADENAAKPIFDRDGFRIGPPKIDEETGETVKNPEQVGAVLLDNKTGAILSFIPGRDFNHSEINYATRSPRHNGSTMKPLLLYAPAYEYGKLQPGSMLADIKKTFEIRGQAPYTPVNFNTGKEYGLVTVRDAVKHSYNISAVRAYVDLKAQYRPMDFLFEQNFKYLTENDAAIISGVLGASGTGVTVLENTSGYATFANNGEYNKPYLIQKIVSNTGETIYEHKAEPKRIYSPQTAYLMIDTMRDVVISGTAGNVRSRLKFSSDWSGKTGTSNYTHDSWFVASNPNVTLGVWFGYEQRRSLAGGASTRTQTMWANLLNSAYEANPEYIGPSERFKMPGGIVRRSYCKLTGLLPSDLCRQAGLVGEDIFNAEFAPTKVDDSLSIGKFVRIGDIAYAPLSSTPSEFVKQGPVLKTDFLKRLQLTEEEFTKLMADNAVFKDLVAISDETLPTNNNAPKQVANVKLSGKTLSWNSSSEKDVIGYYVYYAQNTEAQARKIASVRAGDDMKTNINQNSGVFYVTAVNATGKESSSSKPIELGDVKPPKEEEEENNSDRNNSNRNRSTNPPSDPSDSEDED
ncbi:transglycosylase domain-containing protein [Bacillus alkalisoli]|uniref:transglycosylase domain-containing protein n=1 Tax=Bacillus alkalisoli TaxID=2011008 RepID=UPI000C24267C|nr:transglycosylase domain-containing protein [Bacillus alkalisoli]